MSKYELLSSIVSSLALLISILLFWFSKINMDRVERIYYGQSEFIIRESITKAKSKITDIMYSSTINSTQHKKQLLKVASEQLLNSYEEACMKYIDSKIDRKRFRQTYQDEIKDIVESGDFKDYFTFASKYDAIKQVYAEWFKLQK